MSYLTSAIGQLPNTKQMVISLWFRVPANVLTEITEEFKAFVANEESDKSRRPLLGIVPLMVFASSLADRDFYFPSRSFGSAKFVDKYWSDGSGFPTCAGAGYVDHTREVQLSDHYYSFEQGDGIRAGGGTKRDPSYIGIDCTGEYPALSVNIRMPTTNTASWEGSWPEALTVEISGDIWNLTGGAGSCPGGPTVIVKPGYGLCFDPAPNSFSRTVTSESNAGVVFGCEPEVFRTRPVGTDGAFDALSEEQAKNQGQVITPDRWHHLLLSFDFSGNVSTAGVHMSGYGDAGPMETRGSGTGVLMWIAFDDVNLTGKDLSVYSMGSGDNSIVTVHGNLVAHDVTYDTTDSFNDCMGNDVVQKTFQQQPKYGFSPADVPFENIGLPASSDYVDAIRQVAMSELQIFTGVSLDTADQNNRRAFIDSKLRPVDPTKGTEGTEGTVDDPRAPAERLLGKKPEILLHGANHWQSGYNTGTLGITVDGKVIPNGQFIPTGGIAKFKPEPSL